MRIISTCLVLLLSGFSFSQFNRTFLHSHWSGGFHFSNYSFYDNQNKVNLISTGVTSSNVAKLITQRISSTGVLEAFDQHDYAVNFPTSAQNTLLLTAIEHGTERDYVLGSGNSGFMYFIWIKTDKATGALLSTVTSTGSYKGAYFEPKLIGNELVTYAVKSSGDLVRVALNTATFTAPTEELVDASIDNAGTFTNVLNSGFKSGNLFEINGQEKVVWGVGVSSAMIFTRTAPSVFTSVTTGIPTTRAVSSFLVDPTTIGLTNGINVEHYNASGTMVTSGTLPGPSNSNACQVECVNNRYHAYYKYNGSSKGIFYLTDQNYQILDSASTTLGIYHLNKSSNGFLMVGSDFEKGLSIDLAGIPDVGKTAYCEAYKTFPVLNKEEYATGMRTPDLSASIGLGTKVIATKDGFPGATYNGLSTVYNLSESFVAFTATDTLANDESSFNEQYDELPGPYTPTAQYDEILESRYNRPYHVTLQMIQDHIDSVAFGSSGYVPVWQILDWPAHGEASLGQAVQLAAFTDINGNNVYEPMLGEYPAIYGTDCVFSITHTRTNGDVGKALEFHSYVYNQSCDTSDVFDNVLMRKVKVISRGAEVDSLFFGGRFDGDLGNYADDYFGTNVNLGMIYNYNGDLNDEANAGRPGFDNMLAAQGVMVLKGFKQENDGQDNPVGVMPGESVNGYGYNDGITDNEYKGLYSGVIFTGTNGPVGQSDPTNAIQLCNMLSGYFQFGDPLYYGGTGFPGAPGVTNILAKYQYSGAEDPLHFGTAGVDPGFEWYEFAPTGVGSSPNPSGDRRGGYSFGATALSNGESFELDYAYLVKRQSVQSTTIMDPVNELFAKAALVRNSFMANEGPCGINFDPVPENLGLDESTAAGDLVTVYPNPTNGLVYINGISENGATIEVFDISGKLLQTVTNFYPTQSVDLTEIQGNIFIFRITDGSKSLQKRVAKH